MAWANWSRKAEPEPDNGAAVGLDLTASRARAVYGPAAGTTPRTLPLEDDTADLPLAISLEQRSAVVGKAGTAILRSMPHLVCRDYLPALGQARSWRAGRLRLDPAGAVAVLAQRLRPMLAGHPSPWRSPVFFPSGKCGCSRPRSRRPSSRSSARTTAALALAATTADDFSTALVADADDHAITWSVLSAGGDRVRVLTTLTQPATGVPAWLDRLLDAVSDRCIRLCRRDPRDPRPAESRGFTSRSTSPSAGCGRANLSRCSPHVPVVSGIDVGPGGVGAFLRRARPAGGGGNAAGVGSGPCRRASDGAAGPVMDHGRRRPAARSCGRADAALAGIDRRASAAGRRRGPSRSCLGRPTG